MSGGFVVDYDGLMAFGQGLANLRGEFAKGSDAIEPLLATVSDGNLRAALKDFTNNWSDERAKLQNNLDKAAGFAVEAAQVYKHGDDVTASSFTGGR